MKSLNWSFRAPCNIIYEYFPGNLYNFEKTKMIFARILSGFCYLRFLHSNLWLNFNYIQPPWKTFFCLLYSRPSIFLPPSILIICISTDNGCHISCFSLSDDKIRIISILCNSFYSTARSLSKCDLTINSSIGIFPEQKTAYLLLSIR